MSCMSLSLSLRRHGDTEDTSKHISAHLCPHLSLFDTAQTHRTRASTLVLTRVLYVLIPVPSMPWGHRGHKRALMCSLVSSSLSLQDHVDTQDMSEHISAHPCPVCPYLSFRRHGDTKDTSEHISAHSCPCLLLFYTAWMHRTQASTSVLTCVLYILIPVPLMPWGHRGHERALMCSLVSLSLSL